MKNVSKYENTLKGYMHHAYSLQTVDKLDVNSLFF